MSVYVELRDGDGVAVKGLPDPSGGRFDAAGGFDRFFDESLFGTPQGLGLSILNRVDPYAATDMHVHRMAALLEDIARVIPEAKAGPELRGLLRLRVMAEACAANPASKLVWVGD